MFGKTDITDDKDQKHPTISLTKGVCGMGRK